MNNAFAVNFFQPVKQTAGWVVYLPDFERLTI
jgi:hypothetical protein